MMLRLTLLAVVCLGIAQAELSDAERSAFQNNGDCGGTVSITEDGDNYIITSNGLPDHHWQCVNPNEPSAQEYSFTVPKNPDVSGTPYCLNMGEVGIAKNGVPFYSPITADIMNAVGGDTQEEFDDCGAHPTKDGQHHYHRLPVTEGSECDNPLYDTSIAEPQFLGIALDGVPIYSQGDGLAEGDLDECHGMEWEERYVYVAVSGHFPYVMGCYRGKPADELFPTPVNCPTDDSGTLCVCENALAGTPTEWHEKCDITCGVGHECGDCDDDDKRRATEEETLVERLVHLMFSKRGRTKRSPRFNRYVVRDVTQCHDPADTEYYDDGVCTFDPEATAADGSDSGGTIPDESESEYTPSGSGSGSYPTQGSGSGGGQGSGSRPQGNGGGGGEGSRPKGNGRGRGRQEKGIDKVAQQVFSRLILRELLDELN